MSKNIIIVIIAVVVLGVGYFAYTKTIKPKIDAQKKQDDAIAGKKDQAVVVEEKKTALVQSLSETEKQRAYVLANKMYDDMKGWDKHNMVMWRDFFNEKDAFFFYVVTDAYPKYDSKNMLDRIKIQNWSYTDLASRRAKLDNAAAEAIMDKIRYRIQNFKL